MEKNSATLKLRNISAEVVTGADAAALQTALQTFLDAGGERVFLHIEYVADLTVLILYSE